MRSRHEILGIVSRLGQLCCWLVVVELVLLRILSPSDCVAVELKAVTYGLMGIMFVYVAASGVHRAFESSVLPEGYTLYHNAVSGKWRVTGRPWVVTGKPIYVDTRSSRSSAVRRARAYHTRAEELRVRDAKRRAEVEADREVNWKIQV